MFFSFDLPLPVLSQGLFWPKAIVRAREGPRVFDTSVRVGPGSLNWAKRDCPTHPLAWGLRGRVNVGGQVQDPRARGPDVAEERMGAPRGQTAGSQGPGFGPGVPTPARGAGPSVSRASRRQPWRGTFRRGPRQQPPTPGRPAVRRGDGQAGDGDGCRVGSPCPLPELLAQSDLGPRPPLPANSWVGPLAGIREG